MDKESLIKHLFALGRNNVKEERPSIKNLTFHKRIYSEWSGNDDGDDFELWIGYDSKASSSRYYLRHFYREWWGGWTYDERDDWYELWCDDFAALCSAEQDNDA